MKKIYTILVCLLALNAYAANSVVSFTGVDSQGNSVKFQRIQFSNNSMFPNDGAIWNGFEYSIEVGGANVAYNVPEQYVYAGTTYNIIAIGRLNSVTDNDYTSQTMWNQGWKAMNLKLGRYTERILKNSFKDCTWIYQIEANNYTGWDWEYTLSYVDDYAFNNSSVRWCWTFNHLLEIGNFAFANCQKLDSYADFKFTKIKRIGDYAFNGSKTNWYLTLPNTLEEIGLHAFENCSELQNVNFDESTSSSPGTRINEMAFASCPKLVHIKLNNSITYLGYKAIPTNIATLENNVYYCGKYAVGTDAINFGDGATIQIKDGTLGLQTAFTENLTFSTEATVNVILPASLKMCSLMPFHFGGNNHITLNITCYATTPPAMERKLERDNVSVTVYVPAGAVNTYRQDTEWRKYNIQAIEGTSIEDVFAEKSLNEILDMPQVRVYTVAGQDVTAMKSKLDKGIYIVRLGNESKKIEINE